MKSADKNMSVFPQGDLSHAESQRCGTGGPRSVAAAIDRKSWKRVRLGDFEQHRNNTCPRSLTSVVGGKTHNIHYGDILVKFGEIVSLRQHQIDFLTEEGEAHSPKDYLQDGDIVIADTAEDETAGKVVEIQDVTDRKVVAGLHTIFLRPPTGLFVRGWLGYWMNSRAYHDQLLPYLTGIKVLSLSKSNLANTEVFYPSKDEQKRIVSALSSIDTHITSLRFLIAKYKSIKKATVNLLLKPKENWRRVKLGDVCFAFSYGVGASAIPYDGINRYIRITDIDDDSHEFRPSPLSSPSHFNHDHIVNEGDILIARTGASVGKSYIYHPNDGKLVFAGFLIRAAINHDIADPYFIFLQTLTDKYRQWVAEESMRSGQPGLNIDQCKDFEFCIPKMSEQHKITAQINEIDAVLNNCKKQLDKAQNLKQGMMSYFFG